MLENDYDSADSPLGRIEAALRADDFAWLVEYLPLSVTRRARDAAIVEASAFYSGMSLEAGMKAMSADLCRLKSVRSAPELQDAKRACLVRVLRLNGTRLVGLSAKNLEEIVAGRR